MEALDAIEYGRPPIICDGCAVNSPWEHRCHGNMARVNDEPAGGPCECRECKVHPIGCICGSCSVTREREMRGY